MLSSKRNIISQLQEDIFRLQGFKVPLAAHKLSFGLDIIENAFPNNIFPTGTIHEFLTFEPEHNAASGGFLAGLINTLMCNGGICIWVSTSRTVFPGTLQAFGVKPDRVIFIDLKKTKDILWVTEEALKCDGLAAVVAELPEMSFTQSRRLQLAVEQSKVTGFILRNNPSKVAMSACAARWQITPIPSLLDKDMPGVGLPRWNVALLKVRNGTPGSWQIGWRVNKFVHIPKTQTEKQQPITIRKAG